MKQHSVADKKQLSCAQSVEAAVILFELNTKKDEIARMAEHAQLPDDAARSFKIYIEWLAFMHAAIAYTLMHRAPAIVAAEYLRGTRQMLQTYAPAEQQNADTFVDKIFTPYVECLVQERQKDCPVLFIQRITGQEETTVNPATLRVVSGVMAMALCSVMDALSPYEMLPD